MSKCVLYVLDDLIILGSEGLKVISVIENIHNVNVHLFIYLRLLCVHHYYLAKATLSSNSYIFFLEMKQQQHYSILVYYHFHNDQVEHSMLLEGPFCFGGFQD